MKNMKKNMNMKRKVTENSGNFVPPLLRKRGPKFFPARSASGKAPALVPTTVTRTVGRDTGK